MLVYILRRLASAISVVLVTIVISFGLFFVAPSDPAGMLCGVKCTPARVAEIEKSLGLDKPTSEQFALYMKGLVVGRTYESGGVSRECPAPCLGFSFKNDQPVLGTLIARLPVNLSLVFGASMIFLITGVTIGSLAAKRPGTTGDRALVGTTLLMSSVPYYIIAILVFLYLVIQVPILPRPAYVSPFQNPGGWIAGMITPWLVLGIYSSTSYARYSRGSMIESLSEDYVRTARAKGLSDRRVTFVHALRAAITPVMTIFGLDVAGLLVSSIFTEKIFGLQGLGITALQSLTNYDLPLIMGTVIVGAVVLVIMNFIVDVLYSVLDPRVRLV
ncbi:MAG: ABC transporter permease [Dermatophilaceae bacterium]